MSAEGVGDLDGQESEAVLERPVAPAPPIATPAGAPDKPQFNSERERQVEQEVEAFDTLFSQFKAESTEAYRARITAVAQGAERAHVRPGS